MNPDNRLNQNLHQPMPSQAIPLKKMRGGIHYRSAQPEDALKLSILYQQVYIQTYGTEGVSDEFANFIHKQFAVARIEATLCKHPDSILVASYKNNLVGVAEIAYGKESPIGNVAAPELSKLYILEWFCGMGIGHHLMQQAEQLLHTKGETELWLWVLKTNTRAVAFYEKQGYKWLGNAFFQMEENSYENKVLVKSLGE
jgi:GNAT superfamily N-acetyltransferase